MLKQVYKNEFNFNKNKKIPFGFQVNTRKFVQIYQLLKLIIFYLVFIKKLMAKFINFVYLFFCKFFNIFFINFFCH